jgi:hypothetical protein
MDKQVLVILPHGGMEWVRLSDIDAEPERFVQLSEEETVFHALW